MTPTLRVACDGESAGVYGFRRGKVGGSVLRRLLLVLSALPLQSATAQALDQVEMDSLLLLEPAAEASPDAEVEHMVAEVLEFASSASHGSQIQHSGLAAVAAKPMRKRQAVSDGQLTLF
jgi:hypothetical protein